MVAKKKPKNAFILFVNDWRKRQTNALPWEASIAQAGLDWVKMSDEEKLPYKMAATRCNQAIKATAAQSQSRAQSSPIKKAQQQPTPLVPAEEEQLTAKLHIDKMVNDSVESIELETTMYCFVMVNYFAQTPNTDMYQPAELAMAEFSLQEGVRRLYHKLINPGCSVYGTEFETKSHAKETHQLPIPPNALGEDNLEGLFKDILEFLEHKNKHRPIFTTTEQIPIVSSALNYLNRGPHELKVYSIEYLYYVLKKSSCQISGTPLPKSLYDTNRVFERDQYEHEPNISCDYHEKRDLSKYCAKSCVTRWGFMFAHYMCNDLAITMLPNRHQPAIMLPIPTVIPKMEKETKQEKEETKKENDGPTATATLIKTECPEIQDDEEDLWNDLNNLTEILEEEIKGRIKTEIVDSDGNEDNLAAPPPPPISLGEIHDELALFTRRMNEIKQEENAKEINSKATKSQSNQNSLKSISHTDKKSSKSKTDEKSSKSKSKRKSDQMSSKSKSDDISSHATREIERRSPRRRSRKDRKVSRSRSRERKPHRNENSSSRHYRKSVSPRARRETVSRTSRRVSRSKSRELISHRRRTYSRETSMNLNNKRHRRRSRSRSNLRINRAIRRSRSRSRTRTRSRSLSRYRYSPKRRRSDSFSPIRRRPPLSERLDSPKPNLNLMPSHSHPSTFTNAPSTINYEGPIHAATNPIPAVPPTDYPMSYGSMQYSYTTTYSTQYYQANQMAPLPVGGVYKQPLLPAPAVPEPHRPYDLRQRLGPPPSLPSRYLNDDDLRHRIRGRPEFYGLQEPMYANYVDYYPPPYMADPNYYGSYHNLPPNVPY